MQHDQTWGFTQGACLYWKQDASQSCNGKADTILVVFLLYHKYIIRFSFVAVCKFSVSNKSRYLYIKQLRHLLQDLT